MWAYRTVTDKPRITQVQEVVSESPTVRTLFFRDDVCSKSQPGQFAMIWALGHDEMPMSLSYARNGLSAVTVKPWGPGSRDICSRGKGDEFGVRGPYGRPFTQVKGSALLVGGGTGLAPLIPLAESLAEEGTKVTLILAGRSKDDLIFLDRVEENLLKKGQSVIIATDNGSFGVKGYASDVAAMVLKDENFDMVYSCGPELMMAKVFQLAEEKGIPMEASLERVMKCGNGICGSCAVGPYLVCTDGTVFNTGRLRELKEEFGHFTRDSCGRRMKLSH